MRSLVVLQQQQRGGPIVVPRPAGDDPIYDTDYASFCQRESERRGIDFAVSRIVCEREGGLTEPARMGNFSGPPWYSGISWHALQPHWGGTGPESWQDYSSFGDTAGMGNSFSARLGWAPGDPRAWRDAMRYCLDGARANGWGAWYGAQAAGIFGFHGIDRSVPWSGTPAEEWDAPTWAPLASPDGYVFPVKGYTDEVQLHWGSFEGGSDLFADEGAAVVAIHAGTVVYRDEWGSLGGNAVQISGDDGLQSYYAHGLRPPAVYQGQRVEAGGFLFGVGTSGNATAAGPHLHFGMGKTIMTGTGPTGGCGSDFNAVGLLRRILVA